MNLENLPLWDLKQLLKLLYFKFHIIENRYVMCSNSLLMSQQNQGGIKEMGLLKDNLIAYEKENFPIEKPTVAELIELSLEEKGMTQKQLAVEIGVSPSRISDYLSGRSEPTLKIARMLCQILNIQPAAMLGI